MAPVTVEVFFPVPEGWGLCQGCETVFALAELRRSPAMGELETLPPSWRPDLERLSAMISSMASSFGGSVRITLLDPRSPAGLIRALLRRAHQYPTFVVGGKTRIVGWDQAAVEQAIKSHAGLAGH